MRYLDTGNRQVDETVYAWLSELLPQAVFFACQTGYFGRDGLKFFESEIHALLNTGGELHLVVGSNDGLVGSADLRYVAELIEGHSPRGTLHIVGANDVLMHPKTYYVETRSGVRHALIGSANLTVRGLTANIEAAVAVNSVDDPDAPYQLIRDAILDWRPEKRSNTLRVDLSNIDELVESGAADTPHPTQPADSTQSIRRNLLFPPLGAILLSRAQPEDKLARQREERDGLDILSSDQSGAGWDFPEDFVGIVKRLTRLDTKAFRDDPGTPYIALPRDIAAYLPMAAYGRNGEPRVDVSVVASVDALPGVVFEHDSAHSAANITYVGMGVTVRSHRDLRFNFLRPIVAGIVEACAGAGIPTPTEGDLAAIVFDNVRRIRLVFVVRDPLRADLANLVTEVRGQWGWLPRTVSVGLS